MTGSDKASPCDHRLQFAECALARQVLHPAVGRDDEPLGRHVERARALRDAATAAWGRPLTMNVSMPIAAVMLDLGFPSAAVKAVPILARTAGLLAHLAEEQHQPLGFLMAAKAEEAVEYEPQRE